MKQDKFTGVSNTTRLECRPTGDFHRVFEDIHLVLPEIIRRP